MTPRQHNVLSYAVALVTMPVATWLSTDGQPSPAVWLLMAAWVAHFARRSAESLWLHRYSKTTFPWSDAVIEYVYYWGFGIWIGLAAAQAPNLDALSFAGLTLFVLAEAGNARAHRMLARLRHDQPGARRVPQGFLFELVSCPHYLCEILSWTGFALMARSWAALGFVGLGSAILIAWATVRHRSYRKDFDGQEGRQLYPARRRALVPFVY